MAQTHTDTNVNQLVINKMTKQEYDNLQQVSDTELYLVEEQVDSVVTQGSTNPVQSNAVYQALQNHHDVIMVYFAHNKAYTVSLTDAYYDTTDEELVAQDPATWTGQTPQMPIITAGYYYDLLTGKIYYIENEGDLPVEVTNVEIQGDTNKLYIDLNTSKAYRWNGSTFVLIAAGGSYNDLTNKPLSVENSKVKYTLSDGTTKLTLAQEKDINDIGIDFTSSAVSGDIASGETLAVMMKKILQKQRYLSCELPYLQYSNLPSKSTDTETACREWIQYIVENYWDILMSGVLYITPFRPNSNDFVIGYFYATDTPNEQHFPSYCSFLLLGISTNILFQKFGTNNYSYYFKSLTI